DNRRHLVMQHRVPGEKIRTIYNGVPVPADDHEEDLFADMGDRAGSLRLLIAGSIEERKGHAVLIDAMKLLPGDVVLTVAGEGPARERLQSLVEGHGMKDRVRFAGFREDIIPLMRGADLLVVPSFVEATPYVIMEAFSVGLPVIASGIFGIPELVTHGSTGRLVRPGDSGALATALAEYRGDRGLLARESTRCREEFEERFTLERCIRETAGVYDELLDRERRERE
ncbi:MAG TPA: glycosyltransferase family 4 protein, partial [Candidatus Krumholzibacterium sp.]|nr:glycosyltransferase family 4 protein [Candidatus Krumholzibacterium sp.]